MSQPSFIYRGHTIEQGPSGRYYIYKAGVQVYSMTSTLDEVHDWIDRSIRNSR